MGAFLNKAGARPIPNQIDIGVKIVDGHPCLLDTEEQHRQVYVAPGKTWFYDTEAQAIELRDKE